VLSQCLWPFLLQTFYDVRLLRYALGTGSCRDKQRNALSFQGGCHDLLVKANIARPACFPFGCHSDALRTGPLRQFPASRALSPQTVTNDTDIEGNATLHLKKNKSAGTYKGSLLASRRIDTTITYFRSGQLYVERWDSSGLLTILAGTSLDQI
jgi:hypothetical protein